MPEYNPGGAFKKVSVYGDRVDPFTGMPEFHPGVDYAAPAGTNIPAASDGQVVYSGYNSSYGNTVVIKSTGQDSVSYYSLYAHMSGENMPLINSFVTKGYIVGLVGNTGRSVAPHLHFELLNSNATVRNASGGSIGFRSSDQSIRFDPVSFSNWSGGVPYVENFTENNNEYAKNKDSITPSQHHSISGGGVVVTDLDGNVIEEKRPGIDLSWADAIDEQAKADIIKEVLDQNGINPELLGDVVSVLDGDSSSESVDYYASDDPSLYAAKLKQESDDQTSISEFGTRLSDERRDKTILDLASNPDVLALEDTALAVSRAITNPAPLPILNALQQTVKTGIMMSEDVKSTTATLLSVNNADVGNLVSYGGTALGLAATLQNPTPVNIATTAAQTVSILSDSLKSVAPGIGSIVGMAEFAKNPSAGTAISTVLNLGAFIGAPFVTPLAVSVGMYNIISHWFGGGKGGGKPILLDLDGNGVKLTSVDQSKAFYDIDGDGLREKRGWLDPNDGFLAFDANKDGKISGRGELSYVDYKEGARTDLEGLIAFDTNNDGKLSAADGNWENFKVWQDKNGNGISELGELKSLAEAGISYLTLASDQVRREEGGNIIFGQGTFTRTDGSTASFADAALGTNGQISSSYSSALVLNLLGGSVHTTNIRGSSASFDLDQDGKAQKSAWISAGEAFLVKDINGNGVIDNGSEMFSASSEGAFSTLAAADSNQNSKIDAGDKEFANLKLWVDKNADGISTKNELYTLSQLGVTSIDINASQTNRYDNGNFINAISSFTYSDGSKGQIAEAMLATSSNENADQVFSSDGATTIQFANGKTVQFLTGSGQKLDVGRSGIDLVVDIAGNNLISAGNAKNAAIIGGAGSKVIGGNGENLTLIAQDGTTVIAGQGQENIIAVGANSTIYANSGDKVSLRADDNRVIADGSIITVSEGIEAEISGSNSSVILNAESDVEISGSKMQIEGQGADISLSGTGHIVDADRLNLTLNAGSDAAVNGDQNILNSNGKGAKLKLDGRSNQLNFNDGFIEIQDDSSAKLIGSNNQINAGARVDLNVQGSGDKISVKGANTRLAVNGSNNSANMQSGILSLADSTAVTIGASGITVAGLSLQGNDNAIEVNRTTVKVEDNAVGKIIGSNNTVNAGGNDTLSIEGSDNLINASGTKLGGKVTVQDPIYNSRRRVIGYRTLTSDVIVNAADNISVSGERNKVNIGGTGSVLNLAGGGNIANVSSGKINFEDNSRATVNGSGNNVSVSDSSSLTFSGSGHSFTIDGIGSSISAETSKFNVLSGSSVSISGRQENVTMASGAEVSLKGDLATVSASGSGSKLTLDGKSANISLSNGQVNLVANAVANITGSNLALDLAKGSNAKVVGDNAKISGQEAKVVFTGKKVDFNTDKTNIVFGNLVNARLLGSSNYVEAGGGVNIEAVGNNNQMLFSSYRNEAMTDFVSTANKIAVSGDGNQVKSTQYKGSEITLFGQNNQAYSNGSAIRIIGDSSASISGDDDSITALGSGAKLSVSGYRDIINFGNGSLNVGSYSQVTVNASNANITAGAYSKLSVNGSNDQVTVNGANAELSFNGANNKASISDGTINFSDASSLAMSSSGIKSQNLLVTGSNNNARVNAGKISIGDNVKTTIWGNGNFLQAGSNDTLTIKGDNTILNADGNGNVVDITGKGEKVNLNNGKLYLGANSQLDFVGNNSLVVAAGTGSSISASGVGDLINLNNGTLSIGNSSQMLVVGNGDNVNIGSGAKVAVMGSSTVNAGSGTTLGLSGTHTVNMSGGALAVASRSNITLNGGNDFVALASQDIIKVRGNNDTIIATGSGDSVNITGTGEKIVLSNGQVNIGNSSQAVISGSKNGIYLGGDDTVTINGSSNNINIASKISETVTRTVRDTRGRAVQVTSTVYKDLIDNVTVNGDSNNVAQSANSAGSKISFTGSGNWASSAFSSSYGSKQAVVDTQASGQIAQAQLLLEQMAGFVSNTAALTASQAITTNNDLRVQLAASWK